MDYMREDLALTDNASSASRATSLAETLNAFAVDVISIESRDDLYWYVARNVVGKLGFVDCVIYEAAEDETELHQVAVLGEKNPYDRTIINPLRIPFGKGITGQVAQSRQPIIIEDLLRNANYIPDIEPARSEICVPLIANGRVVGVIDSEHPDPGVFGESELQTLTTVAAMTSGKLSLLAETERSNWRYDNLVKSHAQLAKEIEARKALEAELFEARKLEAIARLTGGFAHSFNNFLMTISGHLEFAAGAVAEASSAAEDIASARKAATQGADLIRNMLAFSQKMHLRPEPTDLNLLVKEHCAPRRNGLSEIQMSLNGESWPVKIDPAAAGIALEHILTNAYEAMPHGGEVRIETQNVHQLMSDGRRQKLGIAPGRYVRVDVTDQGVGMSDEVMSRIFDPFFTTKSGVQGAGLGLSMVQGFMKQIGGAVDVRPSQPLGTTMQLYFPASV